MRSGQLVVLYALSFALTVHYDLQACKNPDCAASAGKVHKPERDSLNEANSNTTDGLHPTPEGYRVIAPAVYHTIIHHRLTGTRILCFGDSITFGYETEGGCIYPSYL